MANLIKTIHRYQNSILLYFIMGVVAFSMIGFGMDFGTRSGRGERGEYAIKIDDHEISYPEFERYRRSLENYYRSMYGKYYQQLVRAQGFNLAQQAVDQMIPNYLLLRTAKKLGLRTGPQQVLERVTEQMPGGNFDRAAYASILRQVGMSAPEFERTMADEALRDQLREIIPDMSRASKAEALSLLQRDETAYDVQYLEFDPAAFAKKVEVPADDKLDAYYQEHASEYERPARASYDFIVFDPKERLDMVEVNEDEIELYYADNPTEFTTADRARLQLIRISIPKEADAAARSELRKKAEEAQDKAHAGEDFKTLAEVYSDDMTTKFNAGDAGWVTRGETKPEKAVVNAAFELGAPGVPDLVTTPSAFYVVKVAEYQPGTQKPLAEVRGQIEKLVKEREAPAWVAEKARGLHETWIKSGKGLTDFGREQNLALESSGGLLAGEQEAPRGFKGLTAGVLQTPDEQRQLIEVGEKLAMVQVAEFKEADVPPLAEVKDQVLKDYVDDQAADLAREAAAGLVEDLKAKKFANITEAGEKLGMEVKEKKGLKRAGQLEPPFNEREASQALFSTYTPFEAPASSYTSEGKHYVFQVSSIQKPDMQKLTDKVVEYRKRAGDLNSETLLTTMINELKMRSEIDVAPRLTDER